MFFVAARDKYRQCSAKREFNTKDEAIKFVHDNGYDKGNGEYSIRNLEVPEC